MKIGKVLMAILVSLSMILSSCSQSVDTVDSQGTSFGETETEKIKIIATTFPIYDWMREIIKDDSNNIELSLLIDTGVDLHSYQPTTEDIANISNADLFVYNGGDSDGWVNEVVVQAMNQEIVTVSLMDTLADLVVKEETMEGMQQSEHAHDHADEDEHAHADEDEHVHADEDEHAHADEDEHAHTDEDEHAHADEDEHAHADEDEHNHADEDSAEEGTTGHDDEHIWLSLENAVEVCKILEDTLSQIDPENADAFSANTENYISELMALDDEYVDALATVSRDTLLFADRFPFRYMLDDYDISYYAAFPGCSAETEASFETITFLSQKVDELDINNVLITDGADDAIANTIIAASTDKDANILILDSLQSINAEDIEGGATYLSVMRDNLEILKTALS